MAKSTKIYDVFVSHADADADLAREVAKACRENGLEAVANTELPARQNVGDIVWDALAESRALIAILSPHGPTPPMAVEIGAARAWNKPIYAIVTDSTARYEGAALKGVVLYPKGRVADVIRLIQESSHQFTEEDRSLLARLYSEAAVSVDQLLLSPAKLEKLVKRFSRASGKRVDGERLLSELLRMRKQKKLVRHRPAGRSAP